MIKTVHIEPMLIKVSKVLNIGLEPETLPHSSDIVSGQLSNHGYKCHIITASWAFSQIALPDNGILYMT